MCVEKCPEKFMTLLKAHLIKSDFEYYKQFCKEGVTSSMVSVWLIDVQTLKFQLVSSFSCKFY